MTDEIKEILQEVNKIVDNTSYNEDITYFEVSHISKLLDYITNLQQDLDKAIDIIEKNRRFYKCRMDEYVDLKKENEELKQTLHNITINDVEEENTTVLDLIKENERLKGDLDLCEKVLDELTIERNDYKSRCEKAIEEISYMSSDKYTDNYDIRDKYYNLLMNILNGSDEK